MRGPDPRIHPLRKKAFAVRVTVGWAKARNKKAFTPAFAGYARRAHASREKRESAGTLWLGACTTRDRGNYRENGVEIVGLDGSLNRSVALLLNL
jgi:hypothetical protein